MNAVITQRFIYAYTPCLIHLITIPVPVYYIHCRARELLYSCTCKGSTQIKPGKVDTTVRTQNQYERLATRQNCWSVHCAVRQVGKKLTAAAMIYITSPTGIHSPLYQLAAPTWRTSRLSDS